ncbi:hypothetical protein OTU49_006325 [Cherax quadricarinatus]|uniref:Uncharacterized protein n=1 Tax=Cherax quadricarinatus TaxID=27406 RepID=A0AAW0X0V3_CHEQU|nr:uncharacterized protein LOC128692414 [Cherax quadricarinatus]XP_053637559.1 uncharacterized protein LOC128692414 [Cherax quadricarinatus]XP_053637560.1 uncharacterized protein LOC128692414 [Cherax quadricarinatus]
MAGETETREQGAAAVEAHEGISPACKSRLMSWRVVGAVLAFLVVLGWIFIIVVLILEEKWQLVLVAWLLLYSTAHFCYWYCKRHSLITLHRQIRLRVLAHIRPSDSGEKVDDHPPTYDEVMKTEAPPPAYFTVVSETVKLATLPSLVSSHGAPLTPAFVTSLSDQLQQSVGAAAREYLLCRPPAYQSPKHLRNISSMILPTLHEERVNTDTAVTATAAAIATVTYVGGIEESETLEDPIRGPIVKHLQSTTTATLDATPCSSSTTRAVTDQNTDPELETLSSLPSS